MTKKDNEKILKKAVDYFVEHVGLKIMEKGDCCVNFSDNNGIGFVNMSLCKRKKKFEVFLESREYEQFIRYFANKF
jgi:hypothetical protein